MKKFIVTWAIEIDAETASEAAHEARLTQLDPDSLATVFEVKEEGQDKVEEIDARNHTILDGEKLL